MRSLVVAAFATVAAVAHAQSARSGATLAPLVELYTSEGCSSCPPADRWLSENAARLAGAVPLALHVDYWDSIGWPDPFAQARFGERQRARSGSVYTPELLVAGREVRDRGAIEEAVRRAAERPARAALTLDLARGSGGFVLRATAKVAAPADRAGAALYLAVFESGLEVDVRAGENAGRRLRHDFVVREWLGPLAVDAAGAVTVERTLPARKNWGVAAFVERGADLLQALALNAR